MKNNPRVLSVVNVLLLQWDQILHPDCCGFLQRVGGNWDGYWLTDSLRHDGDGISGGIAY